MELVIGNKNYSSWSMRPWVLARQAGIPFDERMVRFDAFDDASTFKKSLQGLSPTGKVPLLRDGTLVVWDTLAIAEYLAERFPERQLWPANTAARACARSICAEMHAGFTALRGACPMNIEADLAATGALIWRDKPAVRADLARICSMWRELLQQYGGPLLFGHFTIADAYFAPICMRINSYALPVAPDIRAYIDHVCALPGVRAWIDEARAEHDFRAFEEPYRLQP